MCVDVLCVCIVCVCCVCVLVRVCVWTRSVQVCVEGMVMCVRVCALCVCQLSAFAPVLEASAVFLAAC